MGERWIKDNLVLSHLINISLCIVVFVLYLSLYNNKRVDERIDKRIIEEYQKPIIGKLDTLINLYSNGRRSEVGDTTVIY